MIPMRTSSVFRSRWMALIWATGIIWFALDFAGGREPAAKTQADGNTPAGPDQDTQKAADALGL
jgi:hypothetical protein